MGSSRQTYDPLMHVALRYDALLEAGDMAGCRVCRRIEEAVRSLLNVTAGGTGETHRNQIRPMRAHLHVRNLHRGNRSLLVAINES